MPGLADELAGRQISAITGKPEPTDQDKLWLAQKLAELAKLQYNLFVGDPIQAMSNIGGFMTGEQNPYPIDEINDPATVRQKQAMDVMDALSLYAGPSMFSKKAATGATGFSVPKSGKMADDIMANARGEVDVWHGSPYRFDAVSHEKIGTGEGAQALKSNKRFSEWFGESLATTTGKPFDDPVIVDDYFIKSNTPINTNMPDGIKNAYEFAKKLESAFDDIGIKNPHWRKKSTLLQKLYDNGYSDLAKEWSSEVYPHSGYDNLIKRYLSNQILSYGEVDEPKLTIGFRYSPPPKSGFSYNYRDERPERGVSIVGHASRAEDYAGPYSLGNRKQHIVLGWDLGFRDSDGAPILNYVKDLGDISNIKHIDEFNIGKLNK